MHVKVGPILQMQLLYLGHLFSWLGLQIGYLEIQVAILMPERSADAKFCLKFFMHTNLQVQKWRQSYEKPYLLGPFKSWKCQQGCLLVPVCFCDADTSTRNWFDATNLFCIHQWTSLKLKWLSITTSLTLLWTSDLKVLDLIAGPWNQHNSMQGLSGT